MGKRTFSSDDSRFQSMKKLEARYSITQGALENFERSKVNLNFSNVQVQYNKVLALLNEVEEFLQVKKGRAGRSKVWYTPVENVPLEDILKPPWAAEIYDKDRIGEEVYQQCLGTMSIMDLKEGMTTIEEAVENIVDLYQQARTAGPDALRKMVTTLTRRPAVTLDRMIGPNGFHRAAFGDYRQISTGVAGIDKVLSMVGLDSGEPSALSKVIEAGKSLIEGDVESLAVSLADPALDPRPARRAAVRKYADSLKYRSFSGG